MLQVYVRGKGRCDFNPTELGFSEAEKLNKGNGWRVNLLYGPDKIWSICLPPFNTKSISKRGNRYFIRTKYRRVVDLINELVDPVAKYLDTHREELGVTKSLSELQTALKRDIFIGRTLHTSVFYNREKQPVELDELTPGINVKVSVKPVVYIRENKDPYVDFEITRAIVTNKSERSEKVVHTTSAQVEVKTSQVAASN
jgi:hypothetical protein